MKTKVKQKCKITLEELFEHKNAFVSLKKCHASVDYKYSVQSYSCLPIFKIDNSIDIILSGLIPEIQNKKYIFIRERGKERKITPICMEDRVIQRVICDYALLPALKGKLIYDNGASTKGKGVDFARQRTALFIEKAKRRYRTNDLFVLKFDVKSYFDSIPHKQCYRVLTELFEDTRIINLIMGIIESYKLIEINQIKDEKKREIELKKLYNHEYVGICLGSQISQIMALAVLNKFDHYIKDKLGIKFYIRYMDDGIIIHNDKQVLNKIMAELHEQIAKYGMHFNKKKTYITKASKGFAFLKVKYYITDTGKVVKKLDQGGIIRMRRKMKKYVNKVKEGKMTYDDVYTSMQSWLAHSKIAHSFHAARNMIKLYNELFGGYKLTREYYKSHPKERCKRKVA